MNEINTRLCKATQRIQDGSAAVCEIINIIEETTIEISIEYQSRQQPIRQGETFESYPRKYLIKLCDMKAKQVRKKARKMNNQ